MRRITNVLFILTAIVSLVRTVAAQQTSRQEDFIGHAVAAVRANLPDGRVGLFIAAEHLATHTLAAARIGNVAPLDKRDDALQCEMRKDVAKPSCKLIGVVALLEVEETEIVPGVGTRVFLKQTLPTRVGVTSQLVQVTVFQDGNQWVTKTRTLYQVR